MLLPDNVLFDHLRITGVGENLTLVWMYAQAAWTHVLSVTGQLWHPDIGSVENENVPMPVRTAVLLLTADLYENREAQSPVVLSQNKTVDRLLAPYRLF